LLLLLLLIDDTKLEIICDIIFDSFSRLCSKPFKKPMIKNTYPAPSASNTTLLPDPRVLQFLKMYSQSLEVVKGKKASIFIGKN
jgi:hypothetical protein